MRISVWCGVAFLASCSLIFAGETSVKPAAPNDILTKNEAAEIDTLITLMVAAGFPDAAKSSVYSGTLAVKAVYNPAKDSPPLPSSASTMQMTMQNGDMTYGYEFDGLHFKLADGSWVIALRYHFKPKPGDAVNTDKATEVKLADLVATAGAAHPFNAEKNAAKWLDGLAPAQRTRSKVSMDRLVPVTMFLKINSNNLAPAIVLLHRAGFSDAAGLSTALADQRARSYWQLRPWTHPDAPFDPTGVYPKSKDEETAWLKSQMTFTSEAPPVALRRALYRWCRAQITVESPEDALFPLEVAAATAKAAVDPKDPQGNGVRADALLKGARLPVHPAANADLAGRLQSWEAHTRQPRMVVSGGGGNVQNGATISTAFEAPAPAYEPKKEDLDGLVALLADERPSRFWDFNGPRTVGDNAWRALATMLKSDPRTLAGYAADKPWTSAERKAASAAVQKWWKDHRKEYVDK